MPPPTRYLKHVPDKIISKEQIKRKTQAFTHENNYLHAHFENVSTIQFSITIAHNVHKTLCNCQPVDKQPDKAFETEIKDHLDEIRKEGRGGSTKLSKSLKEAIKFLATSNEIAQVTLAIEQTLEEMTDINLDALLNGLEDVEIGDLEWEEGIKNYRNCTVEQAFAELGITQNLFPSFNQYCDANGCVDPWSAEWDQFLKDPQSIKEAIIPRWHQVIGVRKMLDMFFDESPLLLMDQVGIDKRKFHNGNIPKRPSVIVVPTALLSQWTAYLHKYLEKLHFDVLPYEATTTNRGNWIKDILGRSQQPPHRQIIVATHSLNEPTALPKIANERTASSTLFSLKTNVLGCDEAHLHRKANKTYVAVWYLITKATMPIMMTVTPIVTGPMDLWNIGRLLGLKDLSDLHLAWGSQMHKDLAAALKKDRKRRKAQGAHTGLQEALSGHVDTGSGKPITAHQRVVLSNLESLKSKFDGHVIRRNHESVDRDGKPILGLPPYKQSILVLEACQKELEMLDDLTDNAEERSKSSAPGMFTSSFYLVFRCGVTHWSFADPSASIPPPKTLAEWTSTKLTKLDTVVQILKHHLAHDNAAMLHEVGDHNVLIPQADHVPRTNITTPDKIVVYSAFTSHNAFIRQVFKVNGIKSMEITGAAPMAQRTNTLSTFRASGRDGPRVLIISQVGSVGLNIEFANVLVLLDSCWSAVEDLQTIGRLHRVPQSKQVLVYRPLLKGSADGWLFQNSHDKASVADAFTQSSERLRNTLRRLEEESVASSTPKQKSKSKCKADSDTDNNAAEAPPKKKKGKGKAKAKDDENIQSDANNVQPSANNVQPSANNVQPDADNVPAVADNVPAGVDNVPACADNVQLGADQPAEAIPKPPVDKGKGKQKENLLIVLNIKHK
ncbi:hypothetical protein PHLCEN_2v5964 [Hermanssonia centrifuga]|uniref:Helicase C-terminal domain-containing protein n=1 Tax=Hermanssonia centrifuga TaxID=98765 RepID=A0A2R6P0W2_9APHY|nr:hypothetical protein PHLCEN_2v5964 [Hermanssonia centrifuga]